MVPVSAFSGWEPAGAGWAGSRHVGVPAPGSIFVLSQLSL